MGKSRSAIANMLRLIDLPDEVLSLLKEGKITNGHARAILGLDDEDQMINLAQKVHERDLSVREVEKIVRRMIAEQDVETLKSTGDESVQRRVYMRDLERRVMDKLGRKVKIKIFRNRRLLNISHGDSCHNYTS